MDCAPANVSSSRWCSDGETLPDEALTTFDRFAQVLRASSANTSLRGLGARTSCSIRSAARDVPKQQYSPARSR